MKGNKVSKSEKKKIKKDIKKRNLKRSGLTVTSAQNIRTKSKTKGGKAQSTYRKKTKTIGSRPVKRVSKNNYKSASKRRG